MAIGANRHARRHTIFPISLEMCEKGWLAPSFKYLRPVPIIIGTNRHTRRHYSFMRDLRSLSLSIKSLKLKSLQFSIESSLYLRPESNRHARRHTILSRARLPVPPLRHFNIPNAGKSDAKKGVSDHWGCKYAQSFAFMQFSKLDKFLQRKRL